MEREITKDKNIRAKHNAFIFFKISLMKNLKHEKKNTSVYINYTLGQEQCVSIPTELVTVPWDKFKTITVPGCFTNHLGPCPTD